MSRQQRAFLLRDQDTMEEGSGVYLREDRDERTRAEKSLLHHNKRALRRHFYAGVRGQRVTYMHQLQLARIVY